jgi:membrane protease YdiL (CAAX protease family)
MGPEGLEASLIGTLSQCREREEWTLAGAASGRGQPLRRAGWYRPGILRKQVQTAWGRLPVLVQAIAIGWILLQAGSLLSVLPLFANLAFHPEVPWSLPVTCAVLACFWAFCSGRGPPAGLRDFRRHRARAGEVAGGLWLSALPVIVFGTLFLVTLRLLAPYLMPVAAPSVSVRLSSLPPATAAGALVAVALGAAVVEETAFRGYMQRPLEERYGIVPALLLTGFMFWVAHLDKVTVTHLPGHLLASAIFGLLAYFTRSLLPPMVAHAAADLVLQPAYFARSPRFVWTSLSARPLWQGEFTLEARHVFTALALVLLCAAIATWLAFQRLARASTAA